MSQAPARLRILHVVPTYLPATRYGGPIQSVHGLCKALAELGHDVSVLTTNVDGAGESDVPLEQPVLLDGVRVRYFRSRYGRRLYFSPPMRRELERAVPEAHVVHLHSVFLWPTAAAARIARAASVPYVLAPRGALVPELIRKRSWLAKRLWLAAIEQRTLTGAAALHVTSEAEYRDALRCPLKLPPPWVIPNGVELPAPGAEAEPSFDRAMLEPPFVLFLGRLSWKKGLDRLLAALEGTALRLLVAGGDDEGLLPELRRLIERYGLAGRVELLGPVGERDKWLLLRRARLLVLPSYNENLGNVVLEAMAVGCPVVVTEEVGAARLVREAGCGLVSHGDAPSLRSALLQLWQDDRLRAEMGRVGAAYAAAHLAWPAIAQTMVERYRTLGLRSTG